MTVTLSLNGAKTIIRKEAHDIWKNTRLSLNDEYGISLHTINEKVIDNGFATLIREIDACKSFKDLDYLVSAWWGIQNAQEWFDSRFRRTENE